MKEIIKRVREERGGFTLAELLIVVAIILVLVAIAVPVFTGNLNDANKAVEQANIQTAKVAVSAQIASSGDTYMKLSDKSEAVSWKATVTVKPGGDVTISEIVPSNAPATEESTATKDDNGNWTVTAYMNETELKTTS